MTSNPQLIGMVVGAVVGLIIISLRARRTMKQRRLRLEWLWITPAVLIAMAAMTLMQFPPSGADWLWLTAALAIGAALGWQRGRMMAITVDPQTHQLNQCGSPAAMILLILLLVARLGMRSALTAQGGVSPALITDGFIIFAIGLLATTRLEMFLRARRLLTEARAARAAA